VAFDLEADMKVRMRSVVEMERSSSLLMTLTLRYTGITTAVAFADLTLVARVWLAWIIVGAFAGALPLLLL